MKTKLEEALEYLGIARRKNAKARAWAWAEEAAHIAGVEVCADQAGNGRWPDLERLEKDIRAALDRVPLIVTRHAGVVEWLELRSITGEVKSHVDVNDVEGRVVYGNLPLHLAVHAARVYGIDMPDLQPEQRGQDLTLAEMDKAGAVLRGYVVTRTD